MDPEVPLLAYRLCGVHVMIGVVEDLRQGRSESQDLLITFVISKMKGGWESTHTLWAAPRKIYSETLRAAISKLHSYRHNCNVLKTVRVSAHPPTVPVATPLLTCLEEQCILEGVWRAKAVMHWNFGVLPIRLQPDSGAGSLNCQHILLCSKFCFLII